VVMASRSAAKTLHAAISRIKVIVARKTKTPELIGSLPDPDTDTCRHQRLRLQPETSNKSPRNDLLAARSRWHNVAHEVVQGLGRLRDCLVGAGQCRSGARRSQRPLAGTGWCPRASGTLRRRAVGNHRPTEIIGRSANRPSVD